MSGTVDMKHHLELQGVFFQKEGDIWVALYAGSQAARDVSLGECVWKAARALGEAK